MEFKYSVRESIPGCLHINIEPNENITGYIGNIDGWLSGDVQIFPEDYMPTVKSIMEGTYAEPEELFWGNEYKTLVRRDLTTITFIFEDEIPEMVPCTLPTQMLYDILEVWGKELAKYRAEREAKNQ